MHGSRSRVCLSDGGKSGPKRFAQRRTRHPHSRMPKFPRVPRRQPPLSRMRGGNQRHLPNRGCVHELHQRHLRRRSRNDPTAIRQAHRQIPPRLKSLLPHSRPLDRQTRMHLGAVSHFAKSEQEKTATPPPAKPRKRKPAKSACAPEDSIKSPEEKTVR